MSTEPVSTDNSDPAKPNEQNGVVTKDRQGIATFKVKVYAPLKTYFDGEAYSIVAVNETGPFDVLPKHRNFISLLRQCEVTVRSIDGDEVVPIDHGVLHVSKDKATIFLDV